MRSNYSGIAFVCNSGNTLAIHRHIPNFSNARKCPSTAIQGKSAHDTETVGRVSRVVPRPLAH